MIMEAREERPLERGAMRLRQGRVHPAPRWLAWAIIPKHEGGREEIIRTGWTEAEASLRLDAAVAEYFRQAYLGVESE